MMDKMLTEEPGLSAKTALMWAVLAKNTLENVTGYSPFQIVFGEQPRLPSVYTSGPPGLILNVTHPSRFQRILGTELTFVPPRAFQS